MTDCFLTILDMSLSASWLVLAIITARFLLKKAPRWLTCSLWALVALRLICPFSFESAVSLIPEFSIPPTTVEETLPERVQDLIWDTSSSPGDKMSVDPTLPHDFHTTEAVTGTISTSHKDASIQLNTYEYMDYEIIEYTDEETPFGIRMRPKMMDSGWISVLYYPNGFIANEEWSSAKGSMGDHKVFWYTSEEQSAYNGINIWTAIEFIDLPGDPGDYVIINDGLDTWMAEYYFDSSTIFDGMKLANME